MGIKSIKCERYAEAGSTDSGNAVRSASDFNISDDVKEALTILAMGGAIATVGGFALAYGANWLGERTPPHYLFPEANKSSETSSGQVDRELIFRDKGDAEKIDRAFTDRHYRIELVGLKENTNPFYTISPGQQMTVYRAHFNITDLNTSETKSITLESGQSRDIDNTMKVHAEINNKSYVELAIKES